MVGFRHRRFRVYRETMELIAFSGKVLARVPGAFLPLKDQLVRAASSIALNIGEGSGEFSAAEKARFYRMARRSAAETITAFDALEALDLVDHDTVDEAGRRLEQIAAALTLMIKTMEARKRR